LEVRHDVSKRRKSKPRLELDAIGADGHAERPSVDTCRGFVHVFADDSVCWEHSGNHANFMLA
jgi:hypothetical protein